jgi:AraC-like DNA-binding protein/ligand-binding sensor protein
MNRPADLIQRISKSDIYRDYERAFSDATELSVALRPTEIWRFALEGKRYQNPFCAMLAKSNRTCAACLETQKRMEEMPGEGAKTVTCFAGLCDTAVPVRSGDKLIGYLQTGQVALRKPNTVQFNKITQQLFDWGVNVDLTQLKDAYYHSRTLAPQQYTAMVKLLEIFATHISTLANEIVVQEDEAESPMVRRARAYIHANQADPIDLDKVAKAMHVSTFYFCKMFKKATGLTFTDYLSRVRVEKAKTLLLNPHLRISEIAYDVGFQSLTHFNRMFRNIVGESPTAYRESKSVRQLLN